MTKKKEEPEGYRVKIKENEKRDKYLDLAREQKKTKKTIEHEGDGGTNCTWCAWNHPQSSIRGLEELEIRRRPESVRTISLLISARILRKILKLRVKEFFH